MPNKQIIFADRLVGLSLQNGLVRMDLAVHAGSGKNKDDQPVQRMEVTTQLVIPVEAFANAVGMQDKLLKELVAREQMMRESIAAVNKDAAPAA